MKIWEYFTNMDDSYMSNDELTSYGRLGWELVSFSVTGSIGDRKMVYIFKRPLQDIDKNTNTTDNE